MFNPLVTLDKNLRPVPNRAETWTLSDDRQQLVFKLRQGVTFHSGRPLTADAVKWNIERAQDPKNQSAVGGELNGVQARAVDDKTLELTLPDPSFPQIFSLLANVLIADPQSDIAQGAAGTGAFKLEALDPGNTLRLVRNPNYWRPDRPLLDEVTFNTFGDPQAAVAALEAGTASIIPCPATDFQRLKAGTATTAIDRVHRVVTSS